MVRNQTYLVFALGECFGVRGRKTLIQDSLICIGLWSKALVLTKSGAMRLGAKVAEVNFRKRVPGAMFQAIDRRVGTTIVTKYGTKRGGVAVGKLIPFGVGVVVGGGFNYLTMRSFKSSATNYFDLKVRCIMLHLTARVGWRDSRSLIERDMRYPLRRRVYPLGPRRSE